MGSVSRDEQPEAETFVVTTAAAIRFAAAAITDAAVDGFSPADATRSSDQGETFSFLGEKITS